MSTELNITYDKSVSALLRERISAGDFPSAVYLVAARGEVMMADALGDAVREPEHHPASLDTIYDLASLTKPLVTGLLTALFVERNELRLDDAVSYYFSEFSPTAQSTISIGQLLTHTSGLPAWRPLYIITGGERERTLSVIAEQPLEYAPGTRVLYSDLGFSTLGLIIEKITGASLAEVARREIFEPLALSRTLFNPPPEMQREVAASESAGNAYEREMCADDDDLRQAMISREWRAHPIWGEVHDGNAHFLGGAAGHAGLFSTAQEVCSIARQFLAGSTELLVPRTCALFRTNMTEGLNEARSFGWQLAATQDSTAGPALAPDSFGHLGFTGTSCWIDSARERIFVLLTNRTHAHSLPFVNINGVRRSFHTLASAALNRINSAGEK